MQTLTRELLNRLWPQALPALKDGILATQADALTFGEIDSTLRLSHFMAQVSHESTGGAVLEENLSYSAERLTEVWAARFPTLLAATLYEHNPRALGNKVYNGRLGNRIGTDDGYDYRGRGLIQTTGRDKYFAVGTLLDLDLIAKPDLAKDPNHALKVACACWKMANANAGADDDSVQRVTRAINGGLNGLQSRQAWLEKWRNAFAGTGNQ